MNGMPTTEKRSRRPFLDRFFGYDYFIAHRSTDGKAYAQALHGKLTSLANPFRCFIDRHDYALGGDLPRMQATALRKSTRLIVIVTPPAHRTSEVGHDWLLSEVREFKASHGIRATIVPIGTRGTLDATVCAESALLSELPHLPQGNCVLEEEESLLRARPSEETIARLILDFTERRQELNRLRLFQSLTAGLAFFLLTAGAFAITTHVQWQRAVHNEQRARVSKTAAEGIVDDMLRDLGQKLNAVGKLELLEDVSRAAENYFARMDPELRDNETEIHAALAALLSGDILWQKGEHDAARQHYLKAEKQLSSLVEQTPENARTWRDLSAARGALDLVSELDGSSDGRRDWLQKATTAVEQAVHLEPANFDYRREALLVRGRAAEADGQTTSAAEWDALIESGRQLMNENPSSLNLRLVSYLYGCAASADENRGDLDKAAARLVTAVQLMFDLEKVLPEDAGVQFDLADCLMNLAFLKRKLERVDEAINALNVANNITRSMRQRDPVNQEWLGLQARLLSVSADMLFHADQKERALQMAHEGATLLRGIQERHPASRKHWRDAALALATFGHHLAKTGDWQAAAASWNAATEMLEKLSALSGLAPDQEATLAITHRFLAEAELARMPPDLEKAREFLSKALDRLRRLQREGKLPKFAMAFIGNWEKRARELAGD